MEVAIISGIMSLLGVALGYGLQWLNSRQAREWALADQKRAWKTRKMEARLEPIRNWVNDFLVLLFIAKEGMRDETYKETAKFFDRKLNGWREKVATINPLIYRIGDADLEDLAETLEQRANALKDRLVAEEWKDADTVWSDVLEAALELILRLDELESETYED